MKINQRKWTQEHGWVSSHPPSFKANLVLIFGSPEILALDYPLSELHAEHPEAKFLGCSTSGEILGAQVSDDTLVITEILLEHTELREAKVEIHSVEDSTLAGNTLGKLLPHSLAQPDGSEAPLVHVLLLSDGLKVNGSLLVRGLVETLPKGVSVTGGLAGDGTRFGHTSVLSGFKVSGSTVAVLGLYGKRLKVGYASLGGWDSFGADRLITRSHGNVLYELDGQPVLSLYKRYLGEKAKDLPASGLLFPLSLRNPAGGHAVVRTLLSIDEKEQSMFFAGDVPEGSYARLMMANFDRLIDGAIGAAHASLNALDGKTPELALLISCVGRKLVLRQRIEEEIEGVREVIGNAAITGFYSYGEICPFETGLVCELHNQTMTITLLSEL